MIAVYLLGGTHAGEVIEIAEADRSVLLEEKLRISTIDTLEGHTGGRLERYDFLMEREGLTVFSAEATDWCETSATQYLLARGLLKLSDATDE